MEVMIEKISVGKRFRKSLGNLDSLAESIDRLGLLQPVTITHDRKLICGYRRLEACKKLGLLSIQCHIASGVDDVYRRMMAERDENVERLELAPTEAAAIAKSLLETEEEEAAKRHVKGTKKGGTTAGKGRSKLSSWQTLPRANTPRDESTRSKARVAKAVGMSRPTLEKAMAVADAASSSDATELDKSIAEEMDSTGKVDPAYKKHKATPRQRRTDGRMRAEQKKLDALACSMEEYSSRLLASPGLTTEEKASLCEHFDAIGRLAILARPDHPCDECGGTGGDEFAPCDACHGDGFVVLRNDSKAVLRSA